MDLFLSEFLNVEVMLKVAPLIVAGLVQTLLLETSLCGRSCRLRRIRCRWFMLAVGMFQLLSFPPPLLSPSLQEARASVRVLQTGWIVCAPDLASQLLGKGDA